MEHAKPQPHFMVHDEDTAETWFWEVARNFNSDLIKRIQAGTTTSDDTADSPKVQMAIDAWNAYLGYTRGVITSRDGGVTHLPS